MMSVDVIMWWRSLCAVAAFNALLWAASFMFFRRRGASLPANVRRLRHWQLALSGVYVFGCAFRSVFPVYDVPRLCLVDHWLSSVLVGRSIATLAELCLVGQLALLLNETALAARSRVALRISLVVVPMIAVAETCSWYSVLTTSNIGHVAEESLWGCAVALLAVSVAALYPKCAPARRPLLAAWGTAGVVYVLFMFCVDVPMYWARWLSDTAESRQYLSVAQGIVDVATRHTVSFRWQDWKHEVVWMSLYFSVAVWLSISLIHAPAAVPQLTAPSARRPRTATSRLVSSRA